jgi:hypothetical protein
MVLSGLTGTESTKKEVGMALEYIVIQNKQVPYVRGTVSPNDCQLDPKNPRIQYLVGQRPGVSQSQLDRMLWEKDQVKALGQSILQNGGVYEPLIVQKNGKGYRVREGNCRTVATRHVAEQYPGDARFATMPAMIFDVDLTEEDLAVLLADMHVAGKIRWDAYEQAKHVSDLYHVYGKTYDWLSNHLRLSKSKITEYLLAYQAMTDYLKLHPEPINVQKFAFFHELMRKKELRERYTTDLQFKQSFQQWVTTGKLTDSKQVRDLSAILSNPDARKALDGSGADQAIKVLVRDDPALESDLFHSVKEATEQLHKAPATELQDLKLGNAQKLIMLRNLSRAIEDLATLAGVKL